MDLGASSVRLFAGRVDGGRLEVREAARMKNGPVQLPDGLHSDLLHVHQEMLEALGHLSRQADGGRLWVGIDSWAVDYGLIDGDGHLLGPPFHYRDERTAGRMEEVDRRLGLERLYEATGIQHLPFNTIFQLMVERESASYAAASNLLMVPDLLAYLLTGQRRFEHTNASTTQLVDTRTGELIGWLLTELGIRKDLFADPVKPAEHYGPVLPGVAASVGMARAPVVVAVASHDTASAVLGVPAVTDGFAYVICGTWSLVGLELDAPVITDASRRANFSNELGYDGTVRFLKNVMGFWMLQECERCWALEGRRVPLVDLLAQAERCEPFRSLVDTSRPDFAVPCDMPERIRSACRQSGEPVPGTAPEVVRCVIDSVAIAACAALEEAQLCSGKRVKILHVVGGGSANRLFLSALAAASGLEVVAGPVEASAIGNLLVQLHSAGTVGDRGEMRDLVARSFPVERVVPAPELARQAEPARSRWQTLQAHR